jgi:hypothetical protein
MRLAASAQSVRASQPLDSADIRRQNEALRGTTLAARAGLKHELKLAGAALAAQNGVELRQGTRPLVAPFRTQVAEN